MRLRGSADVLEARRRQAMELLDDGLSLNEVARRIRCSPTSVMRWRDRRDEEGEMGLKVRASPGRPPKLSAGQRERLVEVLLEGAMAQGYRTELWTAQRVAEVIERKFGVRYHPDHVGRILHSLDWSPQKPERRAVERNEESIDRWKREAWPRIKKKPGGSRRTSFSPTNRGSS